MNKKITNHEDLDVWKRSLEYVTLLYHKIDFPKHEQYSLESQMKRAAISIPSNIAEGAARGTKKEFIRFLNISLGSCAELRTQIFIAHNLMYFSTEELNTLQDELNIIKRIILGLRRSLKN